MAKTFTTMVGLQNYIESACKKAVKDTADELRDKLEMFINDEYYDKYEPESYVRTDKFKKSAVSKMIGEATASIGVSEDYLSYSYPARYRNIDGSQGHWTGEDQAYMADAGYHGNAYIYRDGHFFKAFEAYCDKNALTLLKQNLRKYGLDVK